MVIEAAAVWRFSDMVVSGVNSTGFWVPALMRNMVLTGHPSRETIPPQR